MVVTVYLIGENNTKTKVFSCPQNELFRKYKWPARPKLLETLHKMQR